MVVGKIHLVFIQTTNSAFAGPQRISIRIEHLCIAFKYEETVRSISRTADIGTFNFVGITIIRETYVTSYRHCLRSQSNDGIALQGIGQLVVVVVCNDALDIRTGILNPRAHVIIKGLVIGGTEVNRVLRHYVYLIISPTTGCDIGLEVERSCILSDIINR